LWGPIVLSAFVVFIASSVIHMVLKWHASDYRGLSNEDDVRAVIRKGNPAPGQYILPYCPDMKQMSNPAMQQKYNEGPNAVLRIMKPGVPNMGSALGMWFGFTLLVSIFTAYVASLALAPGADYMTVFRVTSAVGFIAYVLGGYPENIWMGEPWSSAFKDTVDGLVYALLMGGCFGWLWP
jgi:hypothetical protein